MEFVAGLKLTPSIVKGVKVPVANQRSILLSLAWHHNHRTGRCFPSIKTLTAESGMGSNNTASRAIVALLEAGVISQERDNLRASYQYTFNFDYTPSDATVEVLSSATVESSSAIVAPLSDATVTPSDATVNVSDATVNEKVPRVVQQLHTNLQSNEPSLEPSFNLPFDEFWKIYPKRKSKGDAVKAWDKLKPDDHKQIICHLNNRVGNDLQWSREGGQFIPYPATFLNRKGWLDEWETLANPYSEKTRRSINNLQGVNFQ